ncbi:MAG: transcription-repair coupling factor [Anaerolineales bacterium]|nr:transcription-repair coupling factor [Anaerolineales bacterium]
MMELDALISLLSQSLASLAQSVQANEALSALGLRRAERPPVLAALRRQLRRPILLLTDRADHTLTFYDELALWSPEEPRQLFPEPNPLFYERSAWGEHTRRERLVALTALAAYHIPGASLPQTPPLIIASARAVMTRTMPRRDFLRHSGALRRGQSLSPDGLARQWALIGYTRANTVIEPGHFARRGGILDLWPASESCPVRLEFFGDEIETIRRFDPRSQRTFKDEVQPDQVLVTPAREYLLPPDWLEQNREQEEELNEFHIPLLHPLPASLLDYLPRDALIVIDNLQAIEDTFNELEEQAVRLREDGIRDGILPTDHPLPYIAWPDFADALSGRQSLELAQGNLLAEEAAPQTQAALVFTPGPRYGGRLKPLIEELTRRVLDGDTVIVVSRQKSRLEELWKESWFALPSEERSRVEAQGAGDGSLAPGISFIQGSLSEGWSLATPAGRLVHLISDGEIFGWRRPEARQRKRIAAEDPEAAYADLQPGDYVVHVDHGIGVFIGLVTRAIDGAQREYLCIEYADEAQLFVPVYQADRLSRYVGPDGRSPSLSRLGGTEWRTVKGHVKESVQEVAQDLLDLYARRSVVQGYRFSSDSLWQEELEASFPYVETDDQVRVLAEVKQDMEAPRPMDRLICGDVGYGKTEVALRAAFKAVMDGRQVAVLVPTTVLAQQHFNTFHQRLAAFPVEVEMLSRFRSHQQQRQILDRLAQGQVDILIGTHRLLSFDVQFKDLGLLIIDEEQRFGVTHKETLKKMRTEVDVLTLTATPIPRTLYMALAGVRDISTINTPPEERLPIVTHVGPYSPTLIRRAVLRELERGGQVFFVHNRVQTIAAMRSHLEKLVPEARIAIAHGQIPENQLSERMGEFTEGEVDILLTTTIIESGLDIPNANTLIVDRADAFGLAQLYQLRGRVGRGAQRAYAYFFRHARRPPTAEGRMRLETIAENTQLGAGFSIAMRDLEIRGAGDILGTRQSGQVAAVGFHLYTRLLSDAVRRLRQSSDLPLAETPVKLPSEGPAAVTVDLPLPVNIPGDYVPEKTMRLRLYRRLADIRTLGEVDAITEEFSDRFGPPPEEVRNLLYQIKVKILAEKAGLASIHAENGQLVLKFPDGSVPNELPDLGEYGRAGKTAIWLSIVKLPGWESLLMEAVGRLAEFDRSRTASLTQVH